MFFRNKKFLLIPLLLANLFFAGKNTENLKETSPQQQAGQSVQPNSFNKSEWTELKKKLKIKDYPPEKKEKSKKDSHKKNKTWYLDIPPKWSLIIKWTIFAILIASLLILVLRVLGINPFHKNTDKNKINIALEELEENLDTAAIDPHLYAAIKSKNFKLAIRLYYLMIIQKLALKEKINWKKHKTNSQYLYELYNKEEYPMVKKLTLTYERSWFGEKDITENEYNTINSDFVNFLQNIK